MSCNRGKATPWLYRSLGLPLYPNLALIVSHSKCKMIGFSNSECKLFTMELTFWLLNVFNVIHSFSHSAGGPGLVPALRGYRSVYFCKLAGT